MSSVTTTRADSDILRRVEALRDDLEHSYRELYYLYQSDGSFQHGDFAQMLDELCEQIDSLYVRFPELGEMPDHILSAPTDLHVA